MAHRQGIASLVKSFLSGFDNFATSSHRVAVISALQHLQCDRDLYKSSGRKDIPTGFGTRSTFQGVSHDVQVNLA